jgi:RHS repeat-associated protein
MLSAGTTPQTVFSLSFGYGAVGHNNGNVMSIINNLDNTRNQTYTYDSLNRVATGQSQATAGTACWGQQFGYDAWGNLQSITGTKTGCSTLTLSANASIKNQLIGFGYDAAGNLTQEGSGTPSWTYTWDAENRLTTLAGSATARYTYDGDDQRAKMTGNGLFWRQPGGPFLSKSGLGGAILAERIYFQGKHIGIWHPGGSINYLVQDALGGEHIVTNATGAVCQDIDTLPFGSEIDYTSACDVSYKFAGIERDDQNSANLDYAINRYYNLRLGRFLTPDFSSSPDLVPFADLNDPRTLNQYGYVRNNPLAGTDVDGHGFWDRVKNCFMYGHCVTDEKIVQMAQQDRNWLKQNCITCYGKSGSDLDKLSNRQIISLYEQVQLDAQHGNVLTGTPPNVGTAPAGPMRTQWGWSGQQSYNAVVRKLNVPNTPEGTVNITEQELGGRLPTREEALRMIQDAGGRVLRDVETHPPGGVSTHTYPHINYETANGIKGAIKVQQ